jgi:hypothetical protein
MVNEKFWPTVCPPASVTVTVEVLNVNVPEELT